MNIKFFKKLSRSVGLPPGSLVSLATMGGQKARIKIIDYSEKEFAEKEITDLNECRTYKNNHHVTWINIDGVEDISSISKMGELFAIHSLVLEDITNTTQRPKLEDYEEHLFIVVKMITFDDERKEINTEQVSFVLGDGFLITFQEREGDVFHLIRERLRNAKGRIRSKGADYLAYALIDAIVDNYFLVLEKIGDEIEKLEEELINDPCAQTQIKIHNLKRELLYLRKSVWPLREVINGFINSESDLVNASMEKYLRDVYDHTIQIIDAIETLRDISSGMLDLYLSNLSNKMNEVMKVLTIMASLFIPITFIAGVYGMNFEYMPELKMPWAYAGIWGVFIAIVLGMLFFFKRKKWF